MSVYQHIAQRRRQVPVRQLCQVLRVEVHAEGHAVGRGRIRRTLAQYGLRAR